MAKCTAHIPAEPVYTITLSASQTHALLAALLDADDRSVYLPEMNTPAGRIGQIAYALADAVYLHEGLAPGDMSEIMGELRDERDN